MREINKITSGLLLIFIGLCFGRQLLDYCTVSVAGVHLPHNELITFVTVLAGGTLVVPAFAIYAVHVAGVAFPFIHL